MGKNSDFPFLIDDVVGLLGLPIHRNNRDAISYYVRCPFCDDKHYHLNISNEKGGVYRCPRCGEEGGMLDLYGKLHNIDNKEAYKAITSGLNLNGSNAEKRVITKKVSPIEIENKSDFEIHAVYSEMLTFPEFNLKQEHYENLKSRGFSDELIEAFGYKSMPKKTKENQINIPKRLEEMGYDLLGIPGFYKVKGKSKIVLDHAGFIIPVRNGNGKIVQAQIRRDNANDNKYVYLSSRYKENGTRTLTRVHVAGDIRRSKRIYVTEGPLKADISSVLLGVPFIALQGVNSQSNLPKALKALKKIGVETIVEAFDMDKFTNPNVHKAVVKITETIKAHGIEVSHARWNPAFKGIDDLLYNDMVENGCS